MLTLTALGLLAAIGCGTLARTLGSRRWAGVLGTLVLVLMGLEYVARIPIRRLPRTAPPIYTHLASLPPTVLAHAPLPRAEGLPSFDADFVYFAQYHRHKVVNGNSGFSPPTYLRLITRAGDLRSDDAVPALRDAGVEYLLVHERYFETPDAFRAATFAIEHRADVAPAGHLAAHHHDARRQHLQADHRHGHPEVDGGRPVDAWGAGRR